MDGQRTCVIPIRLHWQIRARNLNIVTASQRNAGKVGKPSKSKGGRML
jgi:hypothetical protein